MNNFVILDERGNWHSPAIQAARARGYNARRIKRGHEVGQDEGGLGFLRPHAIPSVLMQNHIDYEAMHERLTTMVQDRTQLELYDDKSGQFWRWYWQGWMPPTWRFERHEKAEEFLRTPGIPPVLVSKADVGASSRNVRILSSRTEQHAHINLVFSRGIEVDHCAGGGREGRHGTSMQRGYVLLQEFIPHDVTWRVNAIGRGRAIFKRYNYPDKPVAQTGNVEPVMRLDDFTDSLLEFSNEIFSAIKTNWCALDVLYDAARRRFFMLETSLGWPWPSPGECMEAPFFGDITQQRNWAGMWDLMFDEYEAGTWSE